MRCTAEGNYARPVLEMDRGGHVRQSWTSSMPMFLFMDWYCEWWQRGGSRSTQCNGRAPPTLYRRD